MSISQVNKLFQNKGCNIAISVVLGFSVIAMLGTGFRGCGNASELEQKQAAQRLGAQIAAVGDVPIYASEIESAYKAQMDQQLSQMTDPNMQAMFRGILEKQRVSMMGTILDNAVKQKILLKLAKDRNLDLSDDAIKKLALETATESARGSFVAQGKLKPDATEAEFIKVLETESKQNFANLKKTLADNLTKQLEDPATKAQLLASFAGVLVQKDYAGKETITDDELKASFDVYKVKRITVTTKPTDPVTPKFKAESVLKEINGGLAFEAAMDKYSSDPADAKKKKSEVVTELPAQGIADDPNLKALADLKPGQVSQVIQSPGGPTIYKMIGKERKLPSDYEKQKSTLKTNQANSKATKKLNDEVAALQKNVKVSWQSEGYHVLYDYVQQSKSTLSPSQTEEIIKRALAAAQTTDAGAMVAAAVAYDAFQREYQAAKPDVQKTMLVKRAEVLKSYTDNYVDVDALIDLAQTYLDLKQKDEFLSALSNAASTNSNELSDKGQQVWIRINGLIGKSENAKLVAEADVSTVRKNFRTWQTDFTENKRAEAERAAQEKKDEAQRKKDEADRAKEAGSVETPKIKDPDNKAGITPLPEKTTPPKK